MSAFQAEPLAAAFMRRELLRNLTWGSGRRNARSLDYARASLRKPHASLGMTLLKESEISRR